MTILLAKVSFLILNCLDRETGLLVNMLLLNASYRELFKRLLLSSDSRLIPKVLIWFDDLATGKDCRSFKAVFASTTLCILSWIECHTLALSLWLMSP